MVLLGMVPVLMQQPPMASSFSINATCFPNFAPWIAARCPDGPEPITIRSKVCMPESPIVRDSFRYCRPRVVRYLCVAAYFREATPLGPVWPAHFVAQ